MMVTKSLRWIHKPISIASLANFRILFGTMMFLSTLRCWQKGWIKTQYVDPSFHFSFMGFEWVKPLGYIGMHLIFAVIGISALLVAFGLFYRIAIVLFFLTFTYVELIDVTYYLNHYYFISLVSFLLIWMPAGNFFSIDSRINPACKISHVPRWMVGSIRLQLGIVYFFAGLAKLNADWLLEALPMKIWLPTKSHLPLVGPLMYKEWMAYLFSWFGAVYDLFIVFFLLNSRTRNLAYLVVLIFHFATALFFPAIGMFPYIMMASSLVYFSGDFHLKLIHFFSQGATKMNDFSDNYFHPGYQRTLLWGLAVFFIIQTILPMRYLAYTGPLFWTEEGYRFSWRVMLMEKVGTATFFIRDNHTSRTFEVYNPEFLTPQQEKMMSTQPDLILSYAHYLAKVYLQRGVRKPQVLVQSFVTLNGKRSAPFIDPQVDLASETLSFKHYKWILPFNISH